MNISDVIEQFIRSIIENNKSDYVDIKRNELAEKFQVVPSQINYVINTRFTFEKGFIVESKRGGGGYIRIRKIILVDRDAVLSLLKGIGEEISQKESSDILGFLYDQELISEREKKLMEIALSRDILQLPLPYRDQLRAKILSKFLEVIIINDLR